MKRGLTILGILLVLVGGVWVLQGADVLQGSSMTGDSKWAIIGAIGIVVGAGLIVVDLRRHGQGNPPTA